jgi:hypothetical protein
VDGRVPGLPKALGPLTTPVWLGIPACSSARSGSLDSSLVRTVCRRRIASGRCRPDTSRSITSPPTKVYGPTEAGRMTRCGAGLSGFPDREPMAGLLASPRMPATARIPAGRPATTWATTTATRAVMPAAGSTRTDMRPGASSSLVSVTTTRSKTTTGGSAMATAARGAGRRAAPAGPAVPDGAGSDGSRLWSRYWLFSSR